MMTPENLSSGFRAPPASASLLPPEPQAVSLDTLRRALHAIEVAAHLIDETGSDQYSATFRQEDGTLGGRVVLGDNGFMVDFGLLGQTSKQPGG